LLAAAANAQQTKIQVLVPFAFVVDNISYSAGDYTVRSIRGDDCPLIIRGNAKPVNGIALSNHCTAYQPSTSTKLVFHSMGNHFFLYQVWVEGNYSGREFPRGRLETQMAFNHTKSEEVIVAANIIR
jgi:hypothetical protein